MTIINLDMFKATLADLQEKQHRLLLRITGLGFYDLDKKELTVLRDRYIAMSLYMEAISYCMSYLVSEYSIYNSDTKESSGLH